MGNPLLDENFLLKLEKNRNREIFARITLLDNNELPIELIEGQVVSGSINIDGTSSVRRSCSLSLVAKDININDFYWGVKSKFRLEIGLLNLIDIQYPDIIWFNQGMYIINSFNAVLSVNNYTINISGKDKMCLLNGDLSGGIMNISEDFGVKWIWKNDEHTEYVAEDIEIKEIIYKGVLTYAGELPHNIIINDIAECGVMLMEYRGKEPLYLIKNDDDKIYENMTLNGGMNCWFIDKNGEIKSSALSALESNGGVYELEIDPSINVDSSNQPTVVYFSLEECEKVKNGEYAGTTELPSSYTIYKAIGGSAALGYRLTNLTYPGELIAAAGDTFTSILDKIVQMLGNFEYFYDINGRFVFLKKKNYITGNWTGLSTSATDEEKITYAENNVSNDTFEYIFDDNYLITNFSTTPNIANVKNDFSAWGVRTTSTGAEIPIHMRCAIDNKPTYYKSISGQVYTSDTVDWREIIYQMAKDYYSHNSEDDFYILVRNNNIITDVNGETRLLYPEGRTGYERYYTDMEAFWRDIYKPVEEAKMETSNEGGIVRENDFVDKDKYGAKGYYIYDTEADDCQHYGFLSAVNIKDVEPNVKYKKNDEDGYVGYSDNTDYYLPTGAVLNFDDLDKKGIYTKKIDEVDSDLINLEPFNEYGPIELPYSINPIHEIKTDIKNNYYTLKPGNIIKAIEIDKNYLSYDGEKYSVVKLLPALTGDNAECLYGYTEKVDDEYVFGGNSISNRDKISIVSKDKEDIYIGIYTTDPIIMLDADDNLLLDSEGNLLTSKEMTKNLKMLDDNTPNVIAINTKNLYYDNYNYTELINIDNNEVVYTDKADDTNKITSTLSLGGQYAIFKKYNINNETRLEELNPNNSYYFKAYINENNVLNKYKILCSFPTTYSTNWQKLNADSEYEDYSIFKYKYYDERYIYFNSPVKAVDDAWSPMVSNNPELLNFWIDFIEPEENGLEKYSVSNIGPRSKVVNENSIKAIYYRETPNVLFEEEGTESEFSHQTGYTYIKLNSALNNLFVMSGQGVSAKDKIEELLNNYTYVAEGVLISGVPIYRLDVNSRISVKDIHTGVSGEFAISRISLPLGHSGMMSITAQKVVKLIY